MKATEDPDQKGTKNMTSIEGIATILVMLFCAFGFAAVYFAYEKPKCDE